MSAGACEMCEMDGISGNIYGTKTYSVDGLRYVLCDRCAALFGLMSHPAVVNMRTMTGELMFDAPVERIEEVREDE